MNVPLLFSILVPAYKVKYLKECIDSVLAQSYVVFELIIVDDKSPEDLYSIVKQYDDERIRYFRNDVGFGAYNVVGNWNKCLEYAKGDYVICMGDDDMLDPKALSEYARLIVKYPGLGLYHGLTEIIDEKGNLITLQESRPENESVYSLIWHRWTGRKQFIGDWVFDTKMLRDNGGFFFLPLAWGSDDISAVMAAIYKGVANTNVVCFKYRSNSRTISNTGDASIKLNAIMQEREWYCEFFKSFKSSGCDNMDEKYLSLCKGFETEYFRKKILNNIREDIRANHLKGVIWIFKGKQYGLCISELAKCWVASLYDFLKIKKK